MCLKLLPDYKKGLPDRLVLLPGGRVIFVETKRPSGGVVSTAQKFIMAKLRKLGFEVCVAWSPEDIDELAKEW